MSPSGEICIWKCPCVSNFAIPTSIFLLGHLRKFESAPYSSIRTAWKRGNPKCAMHGIQHEMDPLSKRLWYLLSHWDRDLVRKLFTLSKDIYQKIMTRYLYYQMKRWFVGRLCQNPHNVFCFWCPDRILHWICAPLHSFAAALIRTFLFDEFLHSSPDRFPRLQPQVHPPLLLFQSDGGRVLLLLDEKKNCTVNFISYKEKRGDKVLPFLPLLLAIDMLANLLVCESHDMMALTGF